MSGSPERPRGQDLPIRTLWTDEQTAALPRQVSALRKRRAVERGAALSAVTGLVLVTLFLRTSAEVSPLTLAATPSVAVSSEERYLDGSVASIAGNGKLHVETQSSEHVVSRLESGSARFEVTARPGRKFQVRAADVVVTVLGTAFTVTHTTEGDPGTPRVRVAVERGLVSVAWPDGQTQLGVGAEGVFPPQTSEDPSSTTAPKRAVSSTSADHSGAAGWRQLAARGDYQGAREALLAPGQAPRSSVADLLLEADVARLAGYPADALTPLRRVYTEFAGDSRAPLAAFTAGKILVDNLGAPAGAADAFARARKLGLQGSLGEDALAREIRARRTAEQTAAVKRLAAEYLRLYPKGRHRALAEQVQ